MKQILLQAAAASFTCILLGLFSCTTGSCFEETNAFVKSSMYLRPSGILTAPDSLTLYGINVNDSVYKKATGIKQALIPLNSSAENCTFVIIINGINDTLKFSYTSYPHLISKECGYTFYHTLENIQFSRNKIDTVTIRKSTITTLNEENIRIFY